MGQVIPSPNIWYSPEIYEVENNAVDPDRAIEAAIRAVRDWTGADVLDIGCGTGFHLPRFGLRARSVIGVEPHPPLLAAARQRVAALGPAGTTIQVRPGTAQALPLTDASVDVAHARWAYFFGPGCEPGLAELDRVMRRGGAAFIIDNDMTRSTFAGWVRRAYPQLDPSAIERFFSMHGWDRNPVLMRWEMASRADFEAVVRIEFEPTLAQAIIDEHEGSSVDYAVNVYSKRY